MWNKREIYKTSRGTKRIERMKRSKKETRGKNGRGTAHVGEQERKEQSASGRTKNREHNEEAVKLVV